MNASTYNVNITRPKSRETISGMRKLIFSNIKYCHIPGRRLFQSANAVNLPLIVIAARWFQGFISKGFLLAPDVLLHPAHRQGGPSDRGGRPSKRHQGPAGHQTNTKPGMHHAGASRPSVRHLASIQFSKHSPTCFLVGLRRQTDERKRPVWTPFWLAAN